MRSTIAANLDELPSSVMSTRAAADLTTSTVRSDLLDRGYARFAGTIRAMALDHYVTLGRAFIDGGTHVNGRQMPPWQLTPATDDERY